MNRTQMTFLLSSLLKAPFWALYNMLPFILYKELHASPWQISLFIALKPLASMLSIYWSHFVHRRRDRLKVNIMAAGFFEYLPFFFFPWFMNSWFVIAAAAFYMALNRGVIPAWMEMLKRNAPAGHRTFSYGSSLSYLGSALLPFVIGPLMDSYVEAWRWLFLACALLGSIPLILQAWLPDEEGEALPATTFQEKITTPWKKAWELVQRRPDFARFQIAFTWGGFGMMLMQPALPIFFIDNLHLSYTNLAIALSLCKGVGFALSSPLWANWLQKTSLFRLIGKLSLLAALFTALLFAAQWERNFVYAAYLIYGIILAGTEMTWSLTGPLFAKDEESSLYSSVNIVMVGVRGSSIPALGGLLCYFLPAGPVLGIGAALCLLAYQRLQRQEEVAFY